MIFYFSATGNSKWIAQTAAKALGDTALDLLSADLESYVFTDKEMLGIVFPVYFCAAPDIVKEYAGRLKPGAGYTYAICDFSNYTGVALEQFSEEVLHLDAGFGLLMPDNSSVMGFHYDTEQSVMEKLRTAPERLQVFIEQIRKKETGIFNDYEGETPEKSTKELAKLIEPYSVTSPFHVEEDKCIGCGLCEKICTANVIRLQEKKPVWTRDHCNICLACINRCPEEAIQYADKSQHTFRYTFSKYKKKLSEDKAE